MPAYLDRSKPHYESGLHVELPHDRCFRLDLCQRVRELKGRGLAEMDYGWWDPGARTMHLLELKDYSPPNPRLESNFLLDECAQKATDCLLVLASVWHDLPLGPHLVECIPEEWRVRPAAAVRLQLTFVVKTSDPTDLEALIKLQDRLRNKLGGRLELFQVRDRATVLVLDHQRAAKAGIPVSAFGHGESTSRTGKPREQRKPR
jgi:hypothetical protein